MYTEHFEVSSHDVDPHGAARPSSVLRYMQEAANHQMRDEKPSYMDLFDQGKAFLLSRMAVELYAPLHQYDRIDSVTWPAPGRGATFYRCSRIERGGECVAQGLGVWALVDIASHRLCRVGEVPMHYTEGPLLPLDGLRFSLPEEMAAVGEHEVRYHEIDVNRHLNNTRYLDLLTDFLPERDTHWASGFSLHYRSEAPLGTRLAVLRGEAEALPDGGLRRCFRTLKPDGSVNIEAALVLRPR